MKLKMESSFARSDVHNAQCKADCRPHISNRVGCSIETKKLEV